MTAGFVIRIKTNMIRNPYVKPVILSTVCLVCLLSLTSGCSQKNPTSGDMQNFHDQLNGRQPTADEYAAHAKETQSYIEKRRKELEAQGVAPPPQNKMPK